MTDLVVVSLEAWDGVWRRNQHLVSRLLRTTPTCASCSSSRRPTRLHDVAPARAPAGWAGASRRVGGRLWLHQPTKSLPRRLDPQADARLADQVVRSAERLGLTDPLLWVNDPAADAAGPHGLAGALRHHRRLAARHRSGARARAARRDEGCSSATAHVVVCSPRLLAAKSPGAGGACRSSRTPSTSRPTGPRPPPRGPARWSRPLYLGTVHRDRVDLDSAPARPGACPAGAPVVLVGPAPLDPADRRRLAAPASSSSARAPSTFPAYLTHADVLLVPHVVTPFTDSLDPIKLYEYRAAGRPVVSTPWRGFATSPCCGAPRQVRRGGGAAVGQLEPHRPPAE